MELSLKSEVLFSLVKHDQFEKYSFLYPMIIQYTLFFLQERLILELRLNVLIFWPIYP